MFYCYLFSKKCQHSKFLLVTTENTYGRYQIMYKNIQRSPNGGVVGINMTLKSFFIHFFSFFRSFIHFFSSFFNTFIFFIPFYPFKSFFLAFVLYFFFIVGHHFFFLLRPFIQLLSFFFNPLLENNRHDGHNRSNSPLYGLT